MSQPIPIVITKKPRKRFGQSYGILCPGCNDFEFERTSIAHARAWAQEHNDKEHNGEFTIEDRTVNP